MKGLVWLMTVLLSGACLSGCAAGPWKWTLSPVKIAVTPQPTAVDDSRVALRALPLLPGATKVMSPSLEHPELAIRSSYLATDFGEENEQRLLSMLEKSGWQLLSKTSSAGESQLDTSEPPVTVHSACYLLMHPNVHIPDQYFLMVGLVWFVPSRGYMDVVATFEPQSSGSTECSKLWNDAQFVKTPQPLVVQSAKAVLRALPILPGATNIVTPSVNLIMSKLSYDVEDSGAQNEPRVLSMLEHAGWQLVAKTNGTVTSGIMGIGIDWGCYLLKHPNTQIPGYPYLIVALTRWVASDGSNDLLGTLGIENTFDPQDINNRECRKLWSNVQSKESTPMP